MIAWLILPNSSANDTPEITRLLKQQWKRFGITLGIFWVLALATGFLNMYLVTPHVNNGYEIILGMKISIVILMFLISMAAGHNLSSGKKPLMDKTKLLPISILLGIIVLGISAWLNISRIDGKGLKHPEPIIQSQPAFPPTTTAPGH
jgi:putative copper export protein